LLIDGLTIGRYFIDDEDEFIEIYLESNRNRKISIKIKK